MRGSKLGAAGCTGVVALALLANAELAFAQPTQAQQNALRSNCRSDFMANCSSVKPGGAEALQCLQRNVAKLSPGCQSAVAAVSPPPAATPPKAAAPASPPRPAATATPAAPAAPTAPAVAVTPPAATPPVAPTPRPQQPARTTTPAPAPPAAAATAKPTAQQQAAIKQSCQSDFMARCRGVQPGGADALRCLQRNAGQVSAGCRSALAAIGGAAPAPAKTATPAPAAAAAGTAAPAAMPTPQQQSAIRFTCRADSGRFAAAYRWAARRRWPVCNETPRG
jgi:hypothetical protein